MLKKILLCSIIYIILLQNVSAVGIGVTPGNLTFRVQAGASDTESLFVINTGTEISNYVVYVDEDYADWFDISPDNFSLDASENKEVILKLRSPFSTKGNYEFKVYTVSSSPSSDFNVGSGIKVPVHVFVSNAGLKIGLLLLIIVIGTGGLYYFKNRK